MPKFDDLSGRKFGMLTVNHVHSRKSGQILWSCTCECGNTCNTYGGNLRKTRSGRTASCGCAKKERMTTLNKKYQGSTSRLPEYHSWWQMVYRCHNEKSKDYENYGGRGIIVCDRWRHSFEKFLEDMGNKCGDRNTLERMDVNKDYEPNNCKWATRTEQSRNMRAANKNPLGVRGVYRSGNKYSAYIGVGKKQRIQLGSFPTLEDAIQARKQAEITYWSS